MLRDDLAGVVAPDRESPRNLARSLPPGHHALIAAYGSTWSDPRPGKFVLVPGRGPETDVPGGTAYQFTVSGEAVAVCLSAASGTTA
jgi:hypothetical protein